MRITAPVLRSWKFTRLTATNPTLQLANERLRRRAEAYRFAGTFSAKYSIRAVAHGTISSMNNAMIKLLPTATLMNSTAGRDRGTVRNQTDPAIVARRRRRVRLARFIAFETVAIAVLLFSVVAGISERFAAESLTPIFRVLPITAAAVAAILPILFFGAPKRR